MEQNFESTDISTKIAVSVIGNRCRLLILSNLLKHSWRYNELHKALNGISQKTLTDHLRALEADGLITRTVYPEVPPHVEYKLTPMGESVRPIIDSMTAWGTAYLLAAQKENNQNPCEEVTQ